jgi:flagellar hook assembly protein FlgD
MPGTFSLSQNYPNPFNPSTKISFFIPKEAFVKLEIYNSTGEKVSTLVSENLTAGNYKYEWNAKSLPSGIYFYKMTADNFVQTRKMILLK